MGSRRVCSPCDRVVLSPCLSVCVSCVGLLTLEFITRASVGGPPFECAPLSISGQANAALVNPANERLVGTNFSAEECRRYLLGEAEYPRQVDGLQPGLTL